MNTLHSPLLNLFLPTPGKPILCGHRNIYSQEFKGATSLLVSGCCTPHDCLVLVLQFIMRLLETELEDERRLEFSFPNDISDLRVEAEMAICLSTILV